MAVSLEQVAIENHNQLRVRLAGTPTEFGTLFGTPASFAAALWALVSETAQRAGGDETEFAAAVGESADFWTDPNAIEFVVPL